MRPPGAFILHGGDVDFAKRQKLLFDKLSVAEKECAKDQSNSSQDADVCSEWKAQAHVLRNRTRNCETRKFRGKESIFKRPERPAPRTNFRSIPDHHRNPHKWTKYSLEDVSTEDMTDQSNAQAALSFLSQLRTRKMKRCLNTLPGKMDIDPPELNSSDNINVAFKLKKSRSCTNIEFKKPESDIEEATPSCVIENLEDKPMFRNSKIIMPEYVVGQKQKKKDKIKQPVAKIDRTKQMKLRHLEEPDDIET